jgi:hypothetical protein
MQLQINQNFIKTNQNLEIEKHCLVQVPKIYNLKN